MEPGSGVARPIGVRRSFLLLLMALLAATLLPPGSPASASCAAPVLGGSEPLVLVRGAEVSVDGRGFVDGCQDSMACPAFGCGECEYADPPPAAYDDVELRLRQGGRTWVLGTADAGSAGDGQLGHVSWTFTVPDAVRRGPARLVTDQSGPVPVRVR